MFCIVFTCAEECSDSQAGVSGIKWGLKPTEAGSHQGTLSSPSSSSHSFPFQLLQCCSSNSCGLLPIKLDYHMKAFIQLHRQIKTILPASFTASPPSVSTKCVRSLLIVIMINLTHFKSEKSFYSIHVSFSTKYDGRK